MKLLELIPAPYRLLAAVLAASLAVAAALAWGEYRAAAGDQVGYTRGHAEFLQLQAEMDRKAAAGERQARAEEQQRLVDQKEATDEVQRIAARDRVAREAQSLRTAAADDRLQRNVATIAARSGAVSGDPAAASQCAADVATLAGVLGACRRVVRQLGRDADGELADARERGLECEGRYDALTKRRPPS